MSEQKNVESHLRSESHGAISKDKYFKVHHISEYSFNEIIDVNKIGQILKQNIAISEIVPRIVFQMHECIRERIIRDFSNNNEKKKTTTLIHAL